MKFPFLQGFLADICFVGDGYGVESATGDHRRRNRQGCSRPPHCAPRAANRLLCMQGVRLAVVMAAFLAATYLCAQVNTAQINGTVTDSSGAVVPNVTVTVANPDTGFTRSAKTTDAGAFIVPFLAPGKYNLRTEARGFASVSQRDIALAVGQHSTINLTLKPGTADEVIEVTGEPPLIEQTRSEIGGSVSQVEVKELPLIDRNFANLTALIPGVRPAQGFDPTKTRVGNVSVNGGDGRQTDVNVDGGDNKDNVVGGLVQNFTVEGIQEFNVITNRYSAESGRTLGSVVNVVTKSGTNAFHGGAFGLFQNDNLNRLDFFTAQSCADAGVAEDDCNNPERKVFHFGGSLGGPVVKDKFFAFGAYENKREPGAITVEPNAFQELSLVSLAGPVRTLDSSYIDHLATVKLDHRISERQNMFYRYGRQKWTQPNDQLGNPFLADASQGTSNTNQFHDFAVQHNFVLSPTVVNSINLHFQDFVNAILANAGRTFTVPVSDGTTVTNPNLIFPSAQIGFNTNVPQQTLQRKYQFRDDVSWGVGSHNLKFGTNYIYMPKFGGFFFFGANGYQLSFWDDPSVILSDTATYPQGFATPGAVQSLTQSGGDGRFSQRPHQLAFYFQDDWKATSRLTLNLGLRWDANINFLPVQLTGDPLTSNRTILLLQQIAAANPGGAAADGAALAQFIAGDPDLLRRETANWKEFQPRLGFTWDPTGSGNHVIRGGYGIAFDQVFQNLTLFSLQQAQQNIFQVLQQYITPSRPVGSQSCPQAGFDLCQWRFGVDPLPAGAAGLTDIETGALGFINDPRMTDPYAQQWSLGWQWQFSPNHAFTADYYHVLGIDEPRVLLVNPQIRTVCDPGFAGSNPADPRCVAGPTTRLLDAAWLAIGEPTGRLSEIRLLGTNNRSVFDSVNLQLKRRFTRKFTFQTSYVVSWARAWGGRPTSSYGGTSLAIAPENQFRENEFSYSNHDERHRFVASGYVQLPWGFEVAPIFQAASARPFDFLANTDLDGDGRRRIDRVCVGSTPASPIVTNGCQQEDYNSLRGKPFVQLDVRTAKNFRLGETASLKFIWEFYNLFDRDNFCDAFGENQGTATFNEPIGYCGAQGFGSPFAGPLRSQFGLRFEF